MILDTTYLLPLSRIAVDTDLLKAVDEGRTGLDMKEFGISTISLFEVQAKAAKLNVSTDFTTEAIETILVAFRAEPFYAPKILEISKALLDPLRDYIDCIIVATAITLKEDLVTEDSRIRKNGAFLKNKYGLNLTNYKEIIEGRYPI